MSTCNCDGTVTGVFQALPDAAYHLAGTTTPMEDAVQACQQAIAQMQASQLDPCDPNYDEVLQSWYATAQGQVSNVVSTTPNQNVIQAAVDKAIGTSAPGTATVPPTNPQPPSTMSPFLIGAIIVLAIGFFLVFL